MLKPFLVFAALVAGALAAQQPAAAPADGAQMVNPVKPTAETQAKAKKMYGYDCAMCHGATGDGKGDLVADMKLTMKDLTDPATLNGVSDGEIFTLIKNGKGQMSGEGDRAKPDDIWNLVIYVRSLAGKPKASMSLPASEPVREVAGQAPVAEGGLPAAVEVARGFDDPDLAAGNALPGLGGSGAEGKAGTVFAPQVMLRPKAVEEETPNPFLWVYHFSNDGGVRW